jgi:hypothetical protein
MEEIRYFHVRERNNAPNSTVASPVFRASETRNLRCFKVNVLSPCNTTSHTRLRPSECAGNEVMVQRFTGWFRRDRVQGMCCHFVVNNIKVDMRDVKRYPVSVPSGTPVTNVGLRLGVREADDARYREGAYIIAIGWPYSLNPRLKSL